MTKFTFVNSQCNYVHFVLFSDFSTCWKYFMFSERTKKISTYLVHGLNTGILIRKVLVNIRDASAPA